MLVCAGGLTCSGTIILDADAPIGTTSRIYRGLDAVYFSHPMASEVSWSVHTAITLFNLGRKTKTQKLSRAIDGSWCLPDLLPNRVGWSWWFHSERSYARKVANCARIVLSIVFRIVQHS